MRGAALSMALQTLSTQPADFAYRRHTTHPDTTDLHMTLLNSLAWPRKGSDGFVCGSMHADDRPEARRLGSLETELSSYLFTGIPPTHSFAALQRSPELLKTIAVGLHLAKFGRLCKDKICTYI